MAEGYTMAIVLDIYNGRGISFYAFGFSYAENLLAQCMG